MKQTSSFLIVIAAILSFSAFTFQSAVSWEIEEGYQIKFISKDPTGVFTKMEGSIQFDENNLSNSNFDVRVAVNSINTGKGMQNKHAVSDKWFDAEQFPYIIFKSSEFEKTNEGFAVSGDMEIRGIVQPFTIPFTFENNTFASSITVDRTVFGIGKPGGKVPNELVVEITVPVSKI